MAEALRGKCMSTVHVFPRVVSFFRRVVSFMLTLLVSRCYRSASKGLGFRV